MRGATAVFWLLALAAVSYLVYWLYQYFRGEETIGAGGEAAWITTDSNGNVVFTNTAGNSYSSIELTGLPSDSVSVCFDKATGLWSDGKQVQSLQDVFLNQLYFNCDGTLIESNVT